MKLTEIKKKYDHIEFKGGGPAPGTIDQLPQEARIQIRKILFALGPLYDIKDQEPQTGSFKEYYRANGIHENGKDSIGIEVRSWPFSDRSTGPFSKNMAHINVVARIDGSVPGPKAEEIEQVLKHIFPNGSTSASNEVLVFKKMVPLK